MAKREATSLPKAAIARGCILSNPPFGTKRANQVPGREDFTIETSNKPLNFVQHILTTLKTGARAEVFKILMEDCNVHTVLRLPNLSNSSKFNQCNSSSNQKYSSDLRQLISITDE